MWEDDTDYEVRCDRGREQECGCGGCGSLCGVQGDGFGFEFEYVYEFGGGEPREGRGELGVVGLTTGELYIGTKR